MRTNATCTLYNRYVVSGVEKYQRTQLSIPPGNCVEWENRKASNVVASGLLTADSAVIYIPFALGANHLDPHAWQALTTKTGFWALAVGDVIVKGLVSDEITTGFTMTNLKALHDDVITVKSVDTFDMGSASLRHWKVSGS